MNPDHLSRGETPTGKVSLTLVVVCSDELGVAKANERLTSVMSALVLDGFGVNLSAGHIVNKRVEPESP